LQSGWLSRGKGKHPGNHHSAGLGIITSSGLRRLVVMKYAAIVVMAVLAVAAFASPASAQVVGGGVKGEFKNHQEFAKTVDGAFKEARERQCPVILCVCEQG
jgi:hypothetical protein